MSLKIKQEVAPARLALLFASPTEICPFNRRAISILAEICDGGYYCNWSRQPELRNNRIYDRRNETRT